eukprot:CAMPEP_0204111986 /NCGR_PEP_ID=MMETSP0361-20130328/2788_1 /ASSEMBLY_ACC=CAM_ASM_000343 /TAXON_ID=268821 /ORGANISM="Scrippsiella Hangoei, Strain SHTV-5" /LENGTH=60 /DNA_ID=CAMNT_0051062121 /DNA_START=20 /DNA_END=203 /DNA_ORIENTATION=-
MSSLSTMSSVNPAAWALHAPPLPLRAGFGAAATGVASSSAPRALQQTHDDVSQCGVRGDA